jgi:citrate synthase
MLSNDPKQEETIKWFDQRRHKVFSYTGGWFPGRGVYSHGFSMLEELVGKKSYFQIMILNATGRLVEKPLADWVEAIFGCLSWPDPRIWCNQIGALAGAVRASNLAATALGCLATDSRTYGALPIVEGVTFIQQALVRYKQGVSVACLVKEVTDANGGKPLIVGYVRPIAKGDERLVAMEKVSRGLGLVQGEHLTLAYAIESYMQEHYGEGMNINGYAAAVLSDHGFTAQEVYQICPLAVASGVTACYLDTRKRPPNSFLPLRCDDMDYQGQAPRPVPE